MPRPAVITYRGPMPPADEEEFLVAVAADPENDELRLELANHLRSYEPGLAQFITMQVTRVQGQRKRSNLDDDVPTADERRLLSGNAVAWSRAVAHYARQAGSDRSQLTFHRGLVARIGMDPRLFMERAPYLLKTTPVRHIDFTACTPATLEQLLAAEHLGRLDSIGFVDLGFDVNMPGFDGIEVCRRLRAREAFARTPIVMLTAAAGPDDARRGLEAGATEYLTKPFSPVRLLTLVDALSPGAAPWQPR